MNFKTDCRFFKGERPCAPYKLCEPCALYKPMGQRILIIKLAAIGDVLRTTPLLTGLKKKWPDSFITWLTYPDSLEVLRHNQLIDRLLVYDLGSILRLEIETFDFVISLDKMVEATALATKIKAPKKKGFCLGNRGELLPLDQDSEYAYRLGLDDRLKFKENTKTYPQIIFEMAGLPYRREEYILNLTPRENDYTSFLRKKYRLNRRKVVGLNTGCGRVFATKKWTMDGFLKLGKLLGKRKVATLILGGPEEEERNKTLVKRLKGQVIPTGCHNTLRQFMSIIDLCDVVVSGDTIALHLAVALKKKVVALFGSTASSEIELYGRGEKLRAEVPCGPCYLRECEKDNICMTTITPEMVLDSVKRLL